MAENMGRPVRAESAIKLALLVGTEKWRLAEIVDKDLNDNHHLDMDDAQFNSIWRRIKELWAEEELILETKGQQTRYIA